MKINCVKTSLARTTYNIKYNNNTIGKLIILRDYVWYSIGTVRGHELDFSLQFKNISKFIARQFDLINVIVTKR